MEVLTIDNVVKQYGNFAAVDHVSFRINRGSLFGLLGPNGAGKTSLIRIITRITGADEGKILINGKKLHQVEPKQIGYLPEERGLYKKMKVGDQLLYLAQLKGLQKREARQKLDFWMEKFDIKDWWNKKIQELSKGMQQKIQFIATIVHEPDVLILDEPFSGLDPINTNLIKNEIYQLRDKGCTIIFSTHRMEQVEEICEDIVLINKGKVILNGSVREIKNDFKEHKFKLVSDTKIPDTFSAEAFEVLQRNGHEMTMQLREGHSSNEILKAFLDKKIPVNAFNEILPSLNEIFIKQVGISNE